MNTKKIGYIFFHGMRFNNFNEFEKNRDVLDKEFGKYFIINYYDSYKEEQINGNFFISSSKEKMLKIFNENPDYDFILIGFSLGCAITIMLYSSEEIRKLNRIKGLTWIGAPFKPKLFSHLFSFDKFAMYIRQLRLIRVMKKRTGKRKGALTQRNIITSRAFANKAIKKIHLVDDIPILLIEAKHDELINVKATHRLILKKISNEKKVIRKVIDSTHVALVTKKIEDYSKDIKQLAK